MNHGFNLPNHKNNIGDTALMSAASRGDPLVARYFIVTASQVNDHDMGGMSALAHCLEGWDKRYITFGHQNEVSFLDVALILLTAGADPCSTDSCDRGCSTSGCTVIHTLPAFFNSNENSWCKDNIWTTVEWLHLLEHGHKKDALRSSLISLLRRSLFEELGMSHTLPAAKSTLQSTLLVHLWPRHVHGD